MTKLKSYSLGHSTVLGLTLATAVQQSFNLLSKRSGLKVHLGVYLQTICSLLMKTSEDCDVYF